MRNIHIPFALAPWYCSLVTPTDAQTPINYLQAQHALDDLDRAERALKRAVKTLQSAGLPVHASKAGDIYVGLGSLSDRLAADVRKYSPGD